MKVLKEMVENNKAQDPVEAIEINDDDDEEVKWEKLEKNFVRSIDDHLARKNNGKKWKKSAGFAPSNNNNCARFLGYRLRGFESTVSFPGSLLRIFDQGHDVEARLIKYLTDMKMVKASQLNLVRANPPIDCFLDILIDLPGYGEMPIEVKSISNEGFVYRKATHKPKDEHYRQVQCYLDIGGWDRGMVFYVNKNNNEYLPIVVERNQEYIDKLYSRWNAIHQAHRRGELSVRPYKKTSKKCRECSAFDWCWNDPEVGVQITVD